MSCEHAKHASARTRAGGEGPHPRAAEGCESTTEAYQRAVGERPRQAEVLEPDRRSGSQPSEACLWQAEDPSQTEDLAPNPSQSPMAAGEASSRRRRLDPARRTEAQTSEGGLGPR